MTLDWLGSQEGHRSRLFTWRHLQLMLTQGRFVFESGYSEDAPRRVLGQI